MDIGSIVGAAGGLMSGIGSLFGGGGGGASWPVGFKIRHRNQLRLEDLVNAIMNQPGYLPRPLKSALDSIRNALNYQTVGSIDQATLAANAQLRDLAQAMAERGVYGGQRTMMEQQLRDNLIRALLEAQRQGAIGYGQAEAGMFQKAFDEAMQARRLLASGGGTPGYQSAGPSLGERLSSFGGWLQNTGVGLLDAFGGRGGGTSWINDLFASGPVSPW